MSRTTAPLSDAACRLAKPTDRAYKLFDGDGRGILLRSQWDVRESLANGKLVHILQDYRQQANIWAVYAAPLANSAKVRVTVEYLRQYFSERRSET